MELMNFEKIDILIIWTGNLYLVLFSPANLSPSCYQLLMAGNLQSALTEGDRCHLPVAPCQNKQLTFLSIARWQTVVLLLSMLHIIMAMGNLSSWFPVFVLIVLLVLLVLAAIFLSDSTIFNNRYKVVPHFALILVLQHDSIAAAAMLTAYTTLPIM